MALFNGDKYKRAYESLQVDFTNQKRLLDEAIKTAENWKKLADDLQESQEQMVATMSEATEEIKRLQAEIKEHILWEKHNKIGLPPVPAKIPDLGKEPWE